MGRKPWRKCRRLYYAAFSFLRQGGRGNALPALRFRYIEENVIKDPASTIIYANGTESPIQSMSNILSSILESESGELVSCVIEGDGMI